MAPMSPVPAARSVSSRMRSFSPAVNVRRLGRSDNSGLAAAGAGTPVGLRPSSVPAPAAAFVSATLLGMTTRQFSCALKSKLPGRLCLIIIGTEGAASPGASIGRGLRHQLDPEWQPLITCVARASGLTFEKDTRSVAVAGGDRLLPRSDPSRGPRPPLSLGH